MELESLIPPALRGRIHKVIIRVGNGPVEQSPPESELDRLPPLNASTTPALNPVSPFDDTGGEDDTEFAMVETIMGQRRALTAVPRP